jgi:hypothetical protein
MLRTLSIKSSVKEREPQEPIPDSGFGSGFGSGTNIKCKKKSRNIKYERAAF